MILQKRLVPQKQFLATGENRLERSLTQRFDGYRAGNPSRLDDHSGKIRHSLQLRSSIRYSGEFVKSIAASFTKSLSDALKSVGAKFQSNAE